MLTKKQVIDEKREQLTPDKKAYMKTVEWIIGAEKNVSEQEKDAFVLQAMDQLVASEKANPAQVLGMDATAYGRQLTKQKAEQSPNTKTDYTSQIPLFVLIGILGISLFLVAMGIIGLVTKDSVIYAGTFVLTVLMVFICIVCILIGGYILWKHYSVTESKSMAAYFLIGSGIVVMYVFVLVFLLMILPDLGPVMSGGALFELILGVGGFMTAALVWKKIQKNKR
ncbi:hypothetical protein BMT55_06190 [Listeria newyorkensis]|uniref:DUF1129 family protein n=1 Tax=Listeria newyorkensis TaxID=1497681 RepID=A0ABX4XUN9_9LIST|nr:MULTISPECIES: DUF1129 family protein [Listeria]KGL39458.1 hypothetical protein EP56_12905 [Listeriaceae bacterium FSL A5-0209]KGL46490.1 hypothetical protein EP58_01595 [Listeria newyorkensis]PNP93013.1 hypothetical protein BMT55_06190 [Listeria newyorkensis]RQW67006.1 DUF1129 family protein [Listeria sp. SHR_NRA_18]WAO21637.1 DUF1129 family protein [Listeria newyorkensis]